MKDCTNCIYFESWRDIFFGDELEPDEYGRCENQDSEWHWTKDEENSHVVVGEDHVCDNFKKI